MIIHSEIESDLIIILCKWPMLVILLVGISLVFYGIFMRRTAITVFIIAILASITGYILQ